MEKIVECQNITKRFGGIVALNDLSLSFQKGELVGIIGPNGAGKTTLFNVITGFEKPNSGAIYFKGENVTGLRPHKIADKGIVRTFQVERPFFLMSVLDGVRVAFLSKRGKRMRDKSKSLEEEAIELLKLVGMADAVNMYKACGTCSHGQLKLLEIARALALKPEVLLLDEPFAGVFPEGVLKIQSILQSLRKRGITVVMIDHRLGPLMEIAERVIVLHFGEKISEGTPKQIAKDEKVVEAYLGRGMKFA
jgi:branched-chain amino acid transport system ATP-binding protein